jgi:hypothetical protein
MNFNDFMMEEDYHLQSAPVVGVVSSHSTRSKNNAGNARIGMCETSGWIKRNQ